MFIQFKLAVCCLLLGICGAVVGCADGNAVSNRAVPPKPVLKPGVPQTPEAAVKTVLDGLKASKPIALWDAMTTSQQDAFNQTIRQFADNIDPEIWAGTLDNANKFLKLAETKKDLILKNPMIKSLKQVKPEELKAGWDPAVKLAKTILQSELADPEKLKKFDGREFFSGTGATLLAQARELSHAFKDDPLKRIDQWSATITQTSDVSAKAVLSLGGPGKDTMDIVLTIDDGKWTSDKLGLLQFVVNNQLLDPLETRFLPYRVIEWKGQYLADMKCLGDSGSTADGQDAGGFSGGCHLGGAAFCAPETNANEPKE